MSGPQFVHARESQRLGASFFVIAGCENENGRREPPTVRFPNFANGTLLSRNFAGVDFRVRLTCGVAFARADR